MAYPPKSRSPAVRRWRVRWLVLVLLVAGAVGAGAAEPAVTVSELAVAGTIAGENLDFTVAGRFRSERAGAELVVAGGDLVLLDEELPEGVSVRREAGRHLLVFASAGTYPVALRFAVAAGVVPDEPTWREARFEVPTARVRELSLRSDRRDLAVEFPGALRQERRLDDEGLMVRAVLGPGRPFAVRWQPRVAEFDGELVFTSDTNSVVRVASGALTVDSVLVYEIAQGVLDTCRIALPADMGVTAVDGAHIRDWRVVDGEAGPELVVELNRRLRERYALQVTAERAIDDLPTTAAVALPLPRGGTRASGELLIGTDSALRLVVVEAAGCTQIDAGEFTALVLEPDARRHVPRGKRFAYQYAAAPVRLELELAAVVPVVDAHHRLALRVGEEDLTGEATIELDIREAPLRELELAVPPGFLVAEVRGEAVIPDAFSIRGGESEADGDRLAIPFREAVLGRQLVTVRLEHGGALVDRSHTVAGLRVPAARSERGFVTVRGDPVVVVAEPRAEGLRRIHTASVPQGGDADYAFRFREPGWRLELAARRREAAVRCEQFHLLTVGDGIGHGTVLATYVITGAPVDRLRFRVPEACEDVEFVGADVVRAEQTGEIWTVELARQVEGDYNLAVAYLQRVAERGELVIGGVRSLDAESLSGYAVCTSQDDLRLEAPAATGAMVPVEADALPDAYRLLVTAPVLAAWSYLDEPAPLAIGVEAYPRARPLSALVELADIETRLAVGADERLESRSVARFKIKNANHQFLSLRLPPTATPPRAWIEDAGGRRPAQVSRAEERLLVQLPRLSDPNAPITLELAYGAVHGASDEPVELLAPALALRNTALDWRIDGPADWALLARGHRSRGDAVASQTDSGPGAVAAAWLRALRRVSLPGWLSGAALATLVAIGVVWWRPRWLLPTALAIALAVWFVLGLGVAADAELGARLAERVDRSQVAISEVLATGDGSATRLELDLVPAWRAGIAWSAVLAALVAVGLAAGAAWWRPRMRSVPILVAIAAGVVVLAAVPPLRPALAHVLGWGLPALVLAAAAILWWRAVPRPLRSRRPLAAYLLLGAAAVGLGACGARGDALPAGAYRIDRVAVDLVVEDDSMRVDLALAVRAGGACALPPLPAGSVLLSDPDLGEHLEVALDGERQRVVVGRAGDHRIALSYLLPLAPSGADGRRRFHMALPEALRNRVRITVPEPGMAIDAPGAVRFEREEQAEATVAEAVIAHDRPLVLEWRPRARSVVDEASVIFADLFSVHRVQRGVVIGRHRLDLRIAQGAEREIRLRIPAGAAVTGVEAVDLGTWRFDPDAGILRARFTRPISGAHSLECTTQVPVAALPQSLRLQALDVDGVEQLRGMLAVASSDAVQVALGEHRRAMNVADFRRQAGALVGDWEPRYAVRTGRTGRTGRDDDPATEATSVELELTAVDAELRTRERATFSIGEERLVYNAELAVEVSKAGVFAIELELPDDYDIDACSAPQVSHWDEERGAAGRRLVVHLDGAIRGTVPLRLALSRPAPDLDAGGAAEASLPVPRVRVLGTRKHGGHLVIAPARGLRLRVRERRAAGEAHPAELGVDREGVLAFRLLGPDWQVVLTPEPVRPMVQLEGLHLARIGDGVVRHEHRLRWDLARAGGKRFTLDLPAGALALAVEGPDIAHWRSERGPDATRVAIELERKWFDRAYPLTLRYETRFERASGRVALAPVASAEADLRRDRLVILTSDRVECRVAERGETLQPVDPRTFADDVTAEDLTAAAFAFRSAGERYHLALDVDRHPAASIQQAEVVATRILSVVAAAGGALTRVELELRVGDRRHLRAVLPPAAEIWELRVDARPVSAARAEDGAWLLPLGAAARGERELRVELVYAHAAGGGDDGGVNGRVELLGPRFDLPLRDVVWDCYLPPDADYHDFAGTLHVDEAVLAAGSVAGHDLQTYEAQVARLQERSARRAQELIATGNDLAEAGEQYAARHALEAAYNSSFSDRALNQDARVQLHRLNREQALVGVLGRRDVLNGERPAPVLGSGFDRDQARRLAHSLTKADSENLAAITRRLAAVQQRAAEAAPRIAVVLPREGRHLRFTRPLKMDPESDLRLAFAADPRPAGSSGGGTIALLLLLVLALLALPLAGVRAVAARLRRAATEDDHTEAEDTGDLLDRLPPPEDDR